MWCPRLDHFVRFNPNGSVSRCGHMINPPEFKDLTELENSQWLVDTKTQFKMVFTKMKRIKKEIIVYHTWWNTPDKDTKDDIWNMKYTLRNLRMDANDLYGYLFE